MSGGYQSLPALIVFILCQKQIYSGIAAGAENKEEGEYGFSRKAFRRFIARRYDMDGLQKLALETKEHLCSTILPFWKSLRDNENTVIQFVAQSKGNFLLETEK